MSEKATLEERFRAWESEPFPAAMIRVSAMPEGFVYSGDEILANLTVVLRDMIASLDERLAALENAAKP